MSVERLGRALGFAASYWAAACVGANLTAALHGILAGWPWQVWTCSIASAVVLSVFAYRMHSHTVKL